MKRIRLWYHAFMCWILRERSKDVWGYHEIESAKLRAELNYPFWHDNHS